MKNAPKPSSTRKPPTPDADRTELDTWLRRCMPDLQPILARLDAMITENIPDLQFAVKWKKAHYGVPGRGWVIELAAYDVSANVVFFAGATFASPPPLGEGSRYVKVRSLAEVETPEMMAWIREAATKPGWR